MKNKVVNLPRKDTSKPLTEPNSPQVEIDVAKGLVVEGNEMFRNILLSGKIKHRRKAILITLLP